MKKVYFPPQLAVFQIDGSTIIATSSMNYGGEDGNTSGGTTPAGSPGWFNRWTDNSSQTQEKSKE